MNLEREVALQEDRLLACVHCGFCLPACPTYVRLGDEADSPRGRLHLMRAVAEGRLDAASDAFQTHIDRCLGCRACETVCPSGVEYGLLLELARARSAEARPPGLLTRFLPALFGSPTASALAMMGGRWMRASGLPRLLVRILPARGISGTLRLAMAMLATSGPSRRLTKSAGGPDGARRRGTRGDGGGTEGPGVPAGGRRVARGGGTAVLEGCVQAGLFARVNRATARVLSVNGFGVAPVPGQGCCGALHAHSGDLEGARRLARRNMAAFEAVGVERVVVNAAGCGAAMKEYGHLLADDPEWCDRARAFSRRVMDVNEALEGQELVEGGSIPLTATWDAPCHLQHAQRVVDAPLRVLRAVPGLTLVPLRGSDECCGGAGIHALTHRELGEQIGRDKVAAIRETGADVIATANPGCMMQIGAGLMMEGGAVDVVHPVELLDASYRRGGLYGSRSLDG